MSFQLHWRAEPSAASSRVSRPRFTATKHSTPEAMERLARRARNLVDFVSVLVPEDDRGLPRRSSSRRHPRVLRSGFHGSLPFPHWLGSPGFFTMKNRFHSPCKRRALSLVTPKPANHLPNFGLGPRAGESGPARIVPNSRHPRGTRREGEPLAYGHLAADSADCQGTVKDPGQSGDVRGYAVFDRANSTTRSRDERAARRNSAG